MIRTMGSQRRAFDTAPFMTFLLADRTAGPRARRWARPDKRSQGKIDGHCRCAYAPRNKRVLIRALDGFLGLRLEARAQDFAGGRVQSHRAIVSRERRVDEIEPSLSQEIAR
ncbi:hypothetical protein ACRAWD_27280 [Caulobacter segnis]